MKEAKIGFCTKNELTIIDFEYFLWKGNKIICSATCLKINCDVFN